MDVGNVRMVAFEDRNGGFVFVKVPGEYGRYVRTGVSTVLVACPACKSAVGVPCVGQYKRYTGSSHADRHVAAHAMLRELNVNINSASRNQEDHPIVRDDLVDEKDGADSVMGESKSDTGPDGIVRSTVDLRGVLGD